MKNLFGTALLAVSTAIVFAGSAQAGIGDGGLVVAPGLPAPSILGIAVAAGIGAIVVAKLRK